MHSFNISVEEGGGCIELQTQGCQGSPWLSDAWAFYDDIISPELWTSEEWNGMHLYKDYLV